MKKTKASGRNIPEAERGTIQVKLRLPPDIAEDLDDLAARWRVTRSGAVARLLELHGHALPNASQAREEKTK